MLTRAEKAYIDKIDPSRVVSVFPYDPSGKILGVELVSKIISIFPDAKVVFMGSVALEIAGQKDIDIYILDKVENFDKYLHGLKSLFGELDKQGDYIKKRFVEWKFEQEGYEVEIYLTEPPERQIKVYEILKANKNLLNEYEQLKLKFDGRSYKDYQKAKYEFYNRIIEGSF